MIDSEVTRLSFLFLLTSLLTCLVPGVVGAQSAQFPADGIYNGFLQQTNIVECDNNNSESITGKLNLFNGGGESVATD